MRAFEYVLPAETAGNDARERRVNLLKDSVGEAARQLTVLLALAIAVHLASSLLLRR